jgi:alkylated DNA repair dioxygenase AlkB
LNVSFSSWQPSLLSGSAESPEVDPSFDGLTRVALDASAWVDHLPGWVSSPDAAFADLLESAPFEQRDMLLYGRMVDQPRLTAFLEADSLPPLVARMRAALNERYGVEFDSVLVNLYRDGRDSVAWHRDRVHRLVANPTVVTVSLGERRRFLLRPRGTSPALFRFEPGHGDLLVMGGTSQHNWEHTVPKTASPVGPRMSVTFRHSSY